MDDTHNVQEIEQRISQLWEKGRYFVSGDNHAARRYSMFLVPPNASGPMHLGNALMIAIQDVLARYHRAKGEATAWIPGTDHGGYETQVTFERELEAKGESKDALSRKELIGAIGGFVARNNETIIRQTKAMGASVDWSALRYTLDDDSLRFTDRMFRKMIADNLIYRSSYMVNYCSACTTMLADIELKEVPARIPRYLVKFLFKDGQGHLSLATARPEFLHAVTHVLVHPRDERFASHIGKTLINPVTGEEVSIIESQRKHDPEDADVPLYVFSPSSKKYDFEYAIRHGLPAHNLLDWNGLMVERYPGVTPEEACAREVEYLMQRDLIESVDDTHEERAFTCKKGHVIHSVIRMTWFLRLDDEQVALRKPALEALKKESLAVQPHWRKKGLVDWIGKMHDWPIARQNAWGIKIPIWYEVTDPNLFTIWFRDAAGQQRYGNLKTLFDEGVSLKDVIAGIERVYAAEGSRWTLEREPGKQYLPETDTFDTWFSSGAWSAMVFESARVPAQFYPSSVVVIGYDLLRLSIAREIIMGQYLTGRLPFRRVYFHQLLKGADGQKMSKSLGNAVTLDTYLQTYGADVTRMTLVSYAGAQEDFAVSDERLEFFKAFTERLWTMARACHVINDHIGSHVTPAQLLSQDMALQASLNELSAAVSADIERYALASAQERLMGFLGRLEEYISEALARDDAEDAAAIFRQVFRRYLVLLHPFVPFLTEDIYGLLFKPARPLAAMRKA